MEETSGIGFEKRGVAGIVTLDRPKALNALSDGMVKALAAQLVAWRDDEAVRHVVVRGRGRAFCAGGDIRAVHDIGRDDKDGLPGLGFFRDEYRLNAMVKHYPKPYVALVDGFVMGGGAGVSVHGSHRVFGESAVFAMPETGIGFFPDIGSSYFLARMPNDTGVYCALAAIRLARGDCLHAGIATHAASAQSFDAIVEALTEATDVDAALAPFLTADVQAETLPPIEREIASIFATGGVEAILARLDAAEGASADWAKRSAAEIRGKSPTSLKVALRQIRAARELAFDDCIRLDYRIASHILTGHDFYEGVRAALVDKDRNPRWRPDRLADVDARAVEAHFLPPSDGDLALP